MYKRAMAGEIENFTGVSAPYEEPVEAEIVVETDKVGVEKAVDDIFQKLEELSRRSNTI